MDTCRLDRPDPKTGLHPLANSWVFWFYHRPSGVRSANINYADFMKRIAEFNSIEDFWSIYQYLKRPSSLPVVSDIQVFKSGVTPTWEDEANVNGGKWIVRIKKGLADRYWESLIIALIGEDFDVEDEICGAVLSLRSSEDIISVWNRSADVPRTNLMIRDAIKRVLNLPSETVMEYKAHKNALVDHSSFRNTDVFR